MAVAIIEKRERIWKDFMVAVLERVVDEVECCKNSGGFSRRVRLEGGTFRVEMN